MNTQYRKPLPGTGLDWFDARAAVEAIAPGAYDGLPYTSRVLAENLVRRCEPGLLTDALKQLIERKSGKFEPEQFKDHYESAVRDLIKRKMKGKKITAEEPEPRRGAEVIDFVDALKRSLGKGGKGKPAATAKARKAAPKRAGRRRRG